MPVVAVPFLEKRAEDLPQDTIDHDAEVDLAGVFDAAHGELTHYPATFAKEIVERIQVFRVELAAEVGGIGVGAFADDSDAGGDFGVEFPGALPIFVGQFGAKLKKRKVEGKFSFSDGWHRIIRF